MSVSVSQKKLTTGEYSNRCTLEISRILEKNIQNENKKIEIKNS
jgi:hypothetical protein